MPGVRGASRCRLKRTPTPDEDAKTIFLWTDSGAAVPQWWNVSDGGVEAAEYRVWVRAPQHVRPVDGVDYGQVVTDQMTAWMPKSVTIAPQAIVTAIHAITVR